MSAMLPLEPAYLLHARPYRNTSVLADFFTLHHGRVNGVVRGARGERSKLRGILQPFLPLLITWRGQHDLVSIQKVEPALYALPLAPKFIAYGFYLNELLSRLLRGTELHDELYFAYANLLEKIRMGEFSEVDLRFFEKQLLRDLGYSLQLQYEIDNGDAILPDQWYHFIPDRGPLKVKDNNAHKSKAFLGASLLSLEKDQLYDEVSIKDAKRLMRQAINQLLGNKPLKTRELF